MYDFTAFLLDPTEFNPAPSVFQPVSYFFFKLNLGALE